jgi:hypothetical protein
VVLFVLPQVRTFWDLLLELCPLTCSAGEGFQALLPVQAPVLFTLEDGIRVHEEGPPRGKARDLPHIELDYVYLALTMTAAKGGNSIMAKIWREHGKPRSTIEWNFLVFMNGLSVVVSGIFCWDSWSKITSAVEKQESKL